MALAEHDIAHTVWFTDDNFFLNEKLITEFCTAYKVGARQDAVLLQITKPETLWV